MKFSRIRAGLYESGNFTIERLDRAAERYPGDDWYNEWRVTQDGMIWLCHFLTLAEAQNAIKEVV